MSSVNKAILIGRLGKEVEVRTFQDGNQVANVTLATSDKYKTQSGEERETTEWHNLVFRGKLAEIAAKYLKKGDQLYVDGKITTREWEHEGQKRYAREILVRNMQMLTPKS